MGKAQIYNTRRIIMKTHKFKLDSGKIVLIKALTPADAMNIMCNNHPNENAEYIGEENNENA
jgi:hypothetical protein